MLIFTEYMFKLHQ